MGIDVQRVSDLGKEEYFLVADEMGVFQGLVTVEGESNGECARPNLDFLRDNKKEIQEKIQQCIASK